MWGIFCCLIMNKYAAFKVQSLKMTEYMIWDLKYIWFAVKLFSLQNLYSISITYQIVTFITYQIVLTKLSLPNCSYQIVAYQIVTWHFGKWQFGKHTIPSLPNCHLPNCPYQNVAYQNVAYQNVTYQIYLTKNPPVTMTCIGLIVIHYVVLHKIDTNCTI